MLNINIKTNALIDPEHWQFNETLREPPKGPQMMPERGLLEQRTGSFRYQGSVSETPRFHVQGGSLLSVHFLEEPNCFQYDI